MKQKNQKKKNIRLPNAVIPAHYNITLAPDLLAHTFEGNEIITVAIKKPVKEITLHSKDLSISYAALEKGKSTFTGNVSYNDALETATFRFSKVISKGIYKLHISFKGVLGENMRGFYKSRYVLNGKEQIMATTQFEATDARRAIPCFDEPAHKAVFEVKLIVPNGKTAISNTLPVDVREHSSGYTVVSFAPTPKMSTYLLAFMVGDFEYTEKKSKNGVLVRVYAVPGKKHQTHFALDVAVRCLDFYEEYFDIKYPLNTLDMIAIPDFASGAMENWGAVTYRETALLVDTEHTSIRTKQWVALVIAHELAHQWFGNLVTMEWWTHLWLNEGFATYIEYLVIDELFPEWKVWEQFVWNEFGSALRLDALEHTHPIEVDVYDPNEIGEIFDEVSYSKGASVIRMLAGYLGKKDFRDGLRRYLKKHSYANASTVHLWDAFEKASGKPVRNMMQNWTRKGGYPLVTLSERGKNVCIKQTRFFGSALSAKKIHDTTKWSVPINYFGEKGKMTDFLLSKGVGTGGTVSAVWQKYNQTETGFYRTLYPVRMRALLGNAVSQKQLSPIDRLGVIRDLFALAEAGNVSSVDALSFVENYKNENDYIVWMEVLSGLLHTANIVAGTSVEKKYKQFARGIVVPMAKKVGWEKRESESHTDTLLRPSILFHAGMYGDLEVLEEAKKRFAKRSKTAVSPDIRGIVYNLVALSGGETEYRELMSMYHKSDSHEEKTRIIVALGQFNNQKLLQMTLAFALSKEVRLQDRNTVIGAVLSNPKGRALAWRFIKKNWKKIVDQYGEGGHLLARLVKPLNHFVEKKDGDDIKKFFVKHDAPAASRTVQQVLEHIYSNDAWRKRDLKKIQKFLGK